MSLEELLSVPIHVVYVSSHAPPLVVLTPEVKLGYMQELTSMNGHVGREATQLLLRICVTGFQKAT